MMKYVLVVTNDPTHNNNTKRVHFQKTWLIGIIRKGFIWRSWSERKKWFVDLASRAKKELEWHNKVQFGKYLIQNNTLKKIRWKLLWCHPSEREKKWKTFLLMELFLFQGNSESGLISNYNPNLLKRNIDYLIAERPLFKLSFNQEKSWQLTNHKGMIF